MRKTGIYGANGAQTGKFVWSLTELWHKLRLTKEDLKYIQGGDNITAQLKAWGNSQGIRLSKELLALVGIKNNDFLEVEVKDGSIVLTKAQKQHHTLEERAQEYGGKLGPYEEFEWGEPVGRERW